MAYDFVNGASYGEHSAVLRKDTGQILWHSDMGDKNAQAKTLDRGYSLGTAFRVRLLGACFKWPGRAPGACSPTDSGKPNPDRICHRDKLSFPGTLVHSRIGNGGDIQHPFGIQRTDGPGQPRVQQGRHVCRDDRSWNDLRTAHRSDYVGAVWSTKSELITRLLLSP